MNKNKFPYTFSGRKHSEETKEKIRLSKLGKKRPPFSKEWIKNQVESRKGYKHSKETKIKIGLSNKEHFDKHPERKELLSEKQREAWIRNPNRKTSTKGFKIGWKLARFRKKDKNNRSCPICKKMFYRRGNRDIATMCCSRKCSGVAGSGENSPMWVHGKSREPYPIEWRKSLRNSIRERDGFTCQVCLKKQSKSNFAVHHIDYKKDNLDPKNLITLCPSCHSKTSTHRKKWRNYFGKKII